MARRRVFDTGHRVLDTRHQVFDTHRRVFITRRRVFDTHRRDRVECARRLLKIGLLTTIRRLRHDSVTFKYRVQIHPMFCTAFD